MKANVLYTDLIELTPESDADMALLRSWESHDVRIASSSNKIGEPMKFALYVQFQPKIAPDLVGAKVAELSPENMDDLRKAGH